MGPGGGRGVRRGGESVPAPAGPWEVAVNLKKLIAWLVVAFVVFYIIKQPQSSADIVKNIGETLGNAATSLSTFVRSLA
jgi:hypothetical protein